MNGLPEFKWKYPARFLHDLQRDFVNNDHSGMRITMNYLEKVIGLVGSLNLEFRLNDQCFLKQYGKLLDAYHQRDLNLFRAQAIRMRWIIDAIYRRKMKCEVQKQTTRRAA